MHAYSWEAYKHVFAQQHVQQHTSVLFIQDHEHACTVKFAVLGYSLAYEAASPLVLALQAAHRGVSTSASMQSQNLAECLHLNETTNNLTLAVALQRVRGALQLPLLLCQTASVIAASGHLCWQTALASFTKSSFCCCVLFLTIVLMQDVVPKSVCVLFAGSDVRPPGCSRHTQGHSWLAVCTPDRAGLLISLSRALTPQRLCWMPGQEP